MPSTFTSNLGIEKPAVGEQDGTWGNTVTENYDLFDVAIAGVSSVTLSATGTTGSPNTLPISQGAASNGRPKFVKFVDAGDLGGTVYVQLTPSTAQKVSFFRNSLSGSRDIVIFQGTYDAARAFTIANGKDALLKFAGTGSTSIVEKVLANFDVDDLNVTNDLTVGNDITATGDVNGANLNVTDWDTAFGWGNHADAGYVDDEVVTVEALSYSATLAIDVASASHKTVTLTGNTTLSFSNLATSVGRSGVLIITQDATGGHTFTLPAEAKTPFGGATITQSTAANTVSALSYFVVSASFVIVNYVGDYQ